MKKGMKRLVVFVGGAGLIGGSLIAVACGSDSTSTSGPLPTANKPDTGTPPPPPPVGPTPPPVSPDGGDGGDCSKAPKLRDNTNGFYCAFVSKDAGDDANPGADGGNNSYCTNTETCCNPRKSPAGTFPDSYCAGPTEAKGTATSGDTACSTFAAAHGFNWIGAADGGSSWECADKAGCAAGSVCCMTGTGVNVGKSTDKSIPASCGALQAYKENGTRCEVGTNCAAGEVKLCSTNDMNCGSGVCTPFAGLFRDLAYCK